MPPYLAMPYFHLSKLPLTTKVALTCFYASMLTAIAFVVILFGERTRWKTPDVAANFAGDERVTRETGVPLDRMYAEPSKRRMYDIIHPHSFMMPLIFFVLLHLMEMSVAPRAFKIALYLASFLAMMITMFAPLLVWTSLSAASLVIPAVGTMMAAFATMILVPAYQMWFGRAGDPPHPGRP